MDEELKKQEEELLAKNEGVAPKKKNMLGKAVRNLSLF